jgi:hypothetical protein
MHFGDWNGAVKLQYFFYIEKGMAATGWIVVMVVEWM